jgi:hypothetical protein
MTDIMRRLSLSSSDNDWSDSESEKVVEIQSTDSIHLSHSNNDIEQNTGNLN